MIEKRFELVGGNIRALLFDSRPIPLIRRDIDIAIGRLIPSDLHSFDLVDISGDVPSLLYSICVIPVEWEDSCKLLQLIAVQLILSPSIHKVYHHRAICLCPRCPESRIARA